MTDHFKKQEYLVQVTIVEARNLVGKDEGSGTSDPYVKITVGNLPPQVSTTAKATNSMAWNQSFTFSNVGNKTFPFMTFYSCFLLIPNWKQWKSCWKCLT